ncbi:hypothetical protein AAMO2058_000496400 [Amorphochlora amoebiformis]
MREGCSVRQRLAIFASIFAVLARAGPVAGAAVKPFSLSAATSPRISRDLGGALARVQAGGVTRLPFQRELRRSHTRSPLTTTKHFPLISRALAISPVEDDNGDGCELTEKERDRNFMLITIIYFSKVLANILTITTGPEIATRHFGPGQFSRALEVISIVNAASAAVEFIANPLWGGLSDQKGRKIFLVAGTLITGLGYLTVAASPQLSTYVCVRLVLTVLPLFTTLEASMADMFSNNPNLYARRNARLQSWSGLGVILGSALGGQLASRDIRIPYVVSGLLTTISVASSTLIMETHSRKKRRKLSLEKLNPFFFILLFRQGSLFARLNLATMLQSLRLYLSDVFQIFLKQVLGWGPGVIGNIYSILGSISVSAGFLAGPCLRIFGPYNLAIWTTAMVAVAFFGYGCTNTPALFFASLAIGAPGALCSIAPNSLIVKMANQKGINFGELTAARQNLGAIVRTALPLLASKLYQVGNRFDVPGLPFFVVAGLIGIGNALLISTRTAEIWKLAAEQDKKEGEKGGSGEQDDTTSPPSLGDDKDKKDN